MVLPLCWVNFTMNGNISENRIQEKHISQQMAANNSAGVFLSKISHYLSNISGSNAYCHKANEDSKALITNAGPPSFFLTFSSANMHACNSLGAECHWYRGSIHCHGVAKLKKDPGLCELSEKALQAHLAELFLNNANKKIYQN